jgi:hypothetical protein
MAKLSQKDLAAIIALERPHMRIALPQELDRSRHSHAPDVIDPSPVPPSPHGHGPHADPIFPIPDAPLPVAPASRVWTPAEVSSEQWWLRAFEGDGEDEGHGGDDEDLDEDVIVPLVPIDQDLGGEEPPAHPPYMVVVSGSAQRIIGSQG